MAATYLDNRLIAMLDVLGFAGRISSKEALKSVADKYARIILRAKEASFNPKAAPGSPGQPLSNFAVGEFVFDTLVLVSEEISPKSVGNFVFATTQLMEMFFDEGFPLRGAISFGDYYSDSDSGVFLSNVFKRLNASGQSQEWSGCVVLDEAEQVVVSNLFGPANEVGISRSSALVRYPVPVKDGIGPVGEPWCLNWPYLMSRIGISSGLSFLASNPVKHGHTKRFLDYLLTLSDDAQQLPAACLPAVRMRVVKARYGMRVKFEDSEMNGVKPGCDITISAMEQSDA